MRDCLALVHGPVRHHGHTGLDQEQLRKLPVAYPKDKGSKNYFLLHVDDSITMGRNARKHYDRLAAHYEMKDMGVPTTWCGVQFEFLPHKIVLNQAAYREYFVEYWAKHPTHPMCTTPHLSPMNSADLRNLGGLPAEDSSRYAEFCGQVNWLQVTGADITPSATHLSRGLGHVTKLHEAAAGHF